MGVTETLVWQFGPGEHHGIKRNITVRQGVSSPPGKYRLYEMSDVAASSPTGANSDVYVSELGADEVIRIGSPTEPFQGAQQQTYVLKYRLAHVANGFPDHAELFWNVTGGRFDIPVDSVKVSVHGPAAVTNALCFKGADRSADPVCGQRGAGRDVLRDRPRPARAGDHRGVIPGVGDHRHGAPICATARPGSAAPTRFVDVAFGGQGTEPARLRWRLAIPVLAAALMGTLVLEARTRRAVCRSDAGAHPGRGCARSGHPRSKGSGCSAVRPAEGSSPGAGRHHHR